MKFTIILLLNACFFISFSQNIQKIDSLKNILSSKNEDVIKVELCDLIFWEYLYYNNDSAGIYAKKGYHLSQSIQNYTVLHATLNMGHYYRVVGDYKNSEKYFKKAIVASKRKGDIKSLANGYYNYALLLCDLSKLDSSLINSRKALVEYNKLNNTTYVGKSLIIIGTAFYYMGEADSSIFYFQKALDYGLKFNISAIVAQAKGLLGFMYESSGDIFKAMNFYENSLDLFMKNGDSLNIASAYNDLGILHDDLGNMEKALEYYQKALRLSNEIRDNDISNTLLNIGSVYYRMNELKKAESYFKEALLNAYENNANRNLMSITSNLIKIYIETNKLDSVPDLLNIQDSLVQIFDEKEMVAMFLFQKAKVHKLKGNYEQAIIEMQKVYDLYKEINLLSEIPDVLNTISSVYVLTKNYRKAENTILKSIKISNSTQNIEMKSVALLILSEIYEKTGKYKKSLEAFKNHKLLADSILNDGNLKEITRMEMKFSFDNQMREKQLEEAKKEALFKAKLKQHRTLSYALIMGAILLLLIIIFVLRGYFIKKRSNKELTIKNRLINEQKKEIEAQRDLVNHQNEEITSSINYASRIQLALLPDSNKLKQILPKSFIMFLPRDIVSGDFYWIKEIGSFKVIVAADCTGHGVPGAFMSMLGISFLNEILKNNTQPKASEVLNHLRNSVKTTLNQDKEAAQKDGMDIALCILNSETLELQYSGAFNPLYIIRNNEMEIVKADKQPVAIYTNEKAFTNHLFNLSSGDKFYIFSDGYADQFGGEKRKKYMSKRFREFISKNSALSMQLQKEKLIDEFMDWKNDNNQVDDVLVIGVEV